MRARAWMARDPYQILFPIGLLHALLGTGLWVAFAMGRVPYPGGSHAQHMFSGFLLSFAAGFMLTAIPRFTGAKRCTSNELTVATGLALGSLLVPHTAFSLLLLVFLAAFFFRRLRARTYSPPPHFVFIPLGLLLGLAGALLMLLTPDIAAGRLFLFYGPMLAFILGIGAKLVAALLGWAKPPTVQITSLSAPQPRRSAMIRWLPTALALLLLAGFVLEALGFTFMGRLLRAACASWIAVGRWHLYKLPRQRGRLAFWLWISSWMLILGLWIHAVAPSLGVHAAHLFFIGGFGLMTMMVASRVTLAHGGHALELETSSPIYPVTGILVILAAMTRFIAPWTPSYAHHLAYASATWITAIIVWSMFFVPRMVRHSKP